MAWRANGYRRLREGFALRAALTLQTASGRRVPHDAITCRAAYYGDLFRTPERQGLATFLRIAPRSSSFC